MNARSVAETVASADRVRGHPHVVGVFAALGAVVLVVPTFADVAILDDWVYARGALTLSEGGRLELHSGSAVYAIFEAVWGALFSAPFGFSHGVLRFSSVVLVGLGALACYGTALELGASRPRAALVTAVYLFNPLTLVLTFTYMTDGHVMALVTMATYFYVRAWKRGVLVDVFWGSALVGLAFLSRSTGVVVAFGAAAFWAWRREWLRAAVAAALPTALAVALRLWYSPPEVMRYREDEVTAGLRDLHATWDAALVTGFLVVVYVGLFALPLVVSARFERPRRPFVYVGLGLTLALLVNGLVGRFSPPARMPYGWDWLNADGLGALALVGAREPFPGWVWTLVTGAALVGAVGAAWLLFSTKGGVVGWVAAVLALALVPTAFVFMPPLDRYFVALLPAVFCLLAPLHGGRRSLAAGWAAAVVMGAFAVAGTHDHLVLQEQTWALGRSAMRDGVSLLELDAGAGWTGWHFSNGGRFLGPAVSKMTDPPWWVGWGYVDSTYVVSVDAPPPGYTVVRTVKLDTWLSRPDALVLSRHNGP